MKENNRPKTQNTQAYWSIIFLIVPYTKKSLVFILNAIDNDILITNYLV